jgi:hypothetical protein
MDVAGGFLAWSATEVGSAAYRRLIICEYVDVAPEEVMADDIGASGQQSFVDSSQLCIIDFGGGSHGDNCMEGLG